MILHYIFNNKNSNKIPTKNSYLIFFPIRLTECCKSAFMYVNIFITHIYIYILIIYICISMTLMAGCIMQMQCSQHSRAMYFRGKWNWKIRRWAAHEFECDVHCTCIPGAIYWVSGITHCFIHPSSHTPLKYYAYIDIYVYI